MLEALALAQETSDFVRDRHFGIASASLGFRYGRSTVEDTGDARFSGYDIHLDLAARGLYGKRFGWAFGLGLSAGGILPQGVDLRFDFLPAGIGVALPRMGFVTLVGGIRPVVSSYDPYGLFLFPVELRTEIDLSRVMRLVVAAELDFSTVPRGHVPGTDGFSALVALRYGHGDRDGHLTRGRYVGVQVWEVRGVPYLGFVLGIQAGFGG
ncbi:hypothetical protein BH09MYX1_BH09MYX1_40160 [soil metagenome]